MRITKNTIPLMIALSFAIAGRTHAQTCTSLEKAPSAELVSFLSAVSPDENNAQCVTSAINQLGARRFEAGAAILIRYLDFHRPLTPNEKLGINSHLRSVGDIYPAVDALAQLGEKGLPIVLQAIEADATTPRARQNAVVVWMEVYRYTDEHPRGVALLKHEEIAAKDDATKQRLRWAVSQAITWCNPSEESACKQAATLGNP